MDDALELFRRADRDGNGVLDGGELMTLLHEMEKKYPQIRTLTGGAGVDGALPRLMEKFDADKNGTFCIKEFTEVMAKADSRLSSHPATAQVANHPKP